MILRFGNNVPGFCQGRPKAPWAQASLPAKVHLWSWSSMLWQSLSFVI